MIISLKSNNPQFSYLIGKNPNNLPKITDCRQGFLFGWFTPQGDTYSIKFIDAPDEVSFKDYQGQEFEYLSSTKYSHPLIVPKAISEFFGKLFTDYEKDEGGFIYELTISAVYGGTLHHIARQVSNYFPGFQLTPLPSTTEAIENPKYYSVKIEHKGSLKDLLETAEVFFIYLAITNDEHIECGQDASSKWFKKLASMDAPYFVRYRFKNTFINNNVDKFKKYKEYLNSTSRGTFEFSPLNNHAARMKFLKPFFRGKVFDVGCGEGFYLKKFGQIPEITNYICVDIDPIATDACQKIAAARGIENVLTFSNVDDVPEELFGGTVILTEVLEHIEPSKAADFLRKCIKLTGGGKLLITTPNREFNKNYGAGDGSVRRDDHLNEMNRDELLNLITSTGLVIDEYGGLGDKVDGEPTTFGLVVAEYKNE